MGKTTLVQVVKAEVKKANYCVADKYISITQEHSSDALLGQLIYGIYRAILACKPGLAKDRAMEEARHFVEVTQSRNISGSVSVVGTGIGLGSSRTTSNPIGGLTLPAPNIIENLLKCALDNGSKGVLLHLNNLENLSEANAEKAADLLRSVRDTGLMIDSLYLIIVGPTSAVQTVINRHPQIKNIFSRTMWAPRKEQGKGSRRKSCYRDRRIERACSTQVPHRAAASASSDNGQSLDRPPRRNTALWLSQLRGRSSSK